MAKKPIKSKVKPVHRRKIRSRRAKLKLRRKSARKPLRAVSKSVTARASRAAIAKGTKVKVVAAPMKKGATKPLPGLKISGGEAGRSKYQLKVEGLIQLGRERGYVTYDEILREFPTIEENVVLLEEMYERFSSAGIDVLEGGGMLEDTSADSVLERKKLQNRRSDAGFDSVQMYLREIGQYPLLNGEQEKTLAKRIVEGDDEARGILARSNLRLVVSIAKKYVNRSPDLTLLDLIQEGN